MSAFQRRTDEALRVADETRPATGVRFWLEWIIQADQSDSDRALPTLANAAQVELRRHAFDEDRRV